ncbi:hypothetical protein BOX15_Mlig014508g1 [Macrostomum lignano]|uniref:non-specific serine/threonine protein kinase n=1 Tax=Macrostomum lignano TaxID=282301 RepID=A0A267H857_9PLAT|nr:hypothetical protein BOX15_Mlig014508g1 [Macrostomum lignano]
MLIRWACISIILLCLCFISMSALDKRVLVGAELDAAVYLADGGSGGGGGGGGEFIDDHDDSGSSGSDRGRGASNMEAASNDDPEHTGDSRHDEEDYPNHMTANNSSSRFSQQDADLDHRHRRDQRIDDEDSRRDRRDRIDEEDAELTSRRGRRYDDDERRNDYSRDEDLLDRHRSRRNKKIEDNEDDNQSRNSVRKRESPDLDLNEIDSDSFGDGEFGDSEKPAPVKAASTRPTTKSTSGASSPSAPAVQTDSTAESTKRSLLTIGKRIVAGDSESSKTPSTTSTPSAETASVDDGWQKQQQHQHADILAELFPNSTPAPTHNNDLIFVSTIDGYFYAVEKYTGIIKWKIKEDPVVQVAFSDKSFLLPDPTNGNLYVVGSSDSDVAIKKLPYSIPELVSISPTRSSDGTFCTGFKRDFWLSVDSRSGMKTDVFSSDRGSQKCPNKANEFSTLPEDTAATGGTGGGGGSGGARYDQAGHSILIGRSQHTLVVYDRLSGAMIWNVTYNDYSAHSITEPDQERLNSGDPAELKYLTSSQSAYLAVVSAGQLLWSLNETKLSSPIVAIYSVASSQVAGDHHRSLVRQLYSPFGDEALRILVDSLRTQRQFPANIGRDSFQPSLFIGASGQHWYALSTYTLSTAKLKPPCRARTPLLEGPIESNPNSLPAIRDLTAAEIAGLYSPPELSKKSRLPIDKRLSDRSSPHGVIELSQGGSATVAAPQQQDLKLIAISVLATLLAVLVPFIVWQWHRTIQALNDSQRGSGGGSADAGPAGSGGGTNHSDSTLERLGRAAVYAAGASIGALPSGWRQIGNISYDPRYVLGRGCEGTLVYKGRFDDREVAVKRMLPDCFSVADKEVQLLRLSDQHLNVVRYYCTEQDAHFRYIALELCDATVVDYAKEANPADRFGLEPSSVLHQALQGLHHLHNLDIVHRDVKPTNLLLCKNAGTGVYRTVISDFGLCKRLSPGRVSFSKRSGLTGTEGWIAPEMFESESSSATCAVDVFSVGCVCYYVLSRGKHPFGDALNRQRNILDGNYSLSALRLDHLANDMIMKMIEHRPLDRLSIDGALKHPFFWSVDEQMHFLTEASDRTDKLPMDDPLMERMESCAPTVCGTDWSDRLDIQVYDNLVTFRGYRTHRLVDLLRAIRNKRNHFRELSPSVQLLLGRSTEEYVHYFTSRYPQLLTYLYNVLVAVKLEHSFERYYSSLDPDYFPKYYRAHMKQAYIKDSKALGTSLSSNQIVQNTAQQQQPNDFSPKPSRRLIARRGRSSGGSDNVDVSRHASDSELVAGNVGPCGSGLPSLFRSPPMQKLQRKAELLKQQTTELETCAVAVGAVEPPGLSRSQENLLAVRQLSANWNRSAALIDSDADPSVIFSADSYSLFRIDSYPHGTQLPDNYCAQTAQTDDNNLDATHHQNEQQAEQQQLDQPEALLLKAKKKTRRGKKAKKSSASNASASVNSMIGADGDQDEPDILLDF